MVNSDARVALRPCMRYNDAFDKECIGTTSWNESLTRLLRPVMVFESSSFLTLRKCNDTTDAQVNMRGPVEP